MMKHAALKTDIPMLDFEKPLAELQKAIDKLKSHALDKGEDFGEQLKNLQLQYEQNCQAIYAGLTPIQTVQIARHPHRPLFCDYVSLLCSDFVELHGDRCFGDDRGLVGGFATIGNLKVMLIGHNKGKNVTENIERNFGQAKPEGYRKALRLMHLAEKYDMPIITLIDTQGAYPGLDAEERGQAEAIARNLTEMAHIKTPIICTVTGEGGSGGALGIGVGDIICMLQYSVYSVISPEGCASILWRDASFAPKAAEALKLTAPSLLQMGVIDEIIPEPAGGAHHDYRKTIDAVRDAIIKHATKLSKLPVTKLIDKRFEKFSKIGKFQQ
ncbi:MAG: acetyl-CoA carboxylase carboxyltransferase subunit alpha [Chitinivibrionales bacterium]|nr:acetyl-CoA carboxylase carboxyltransferase subunit alpha [Chitinivibrionales bacterium]